MISSEFLSEGAECGACVVHVFPSIYAVNRERNESCLSTKTLDAQKNIRSRANAFSVAANVSPSPSLFSDKGGLPCRVVHCRKLAAQA